MHVTAQVDHAISAAIALPEPAEKPVAGATLALAGHLLPVPDDHHRPAQEGQAVPVHRDPHGGLSLARRSDDIAWPT